RDLEPDETDAAVDVEDALRAEAACPCAPERAEDARDDRLGAGGVRLEERRGCHVVDEARDLRPVARGAEEDARLGAEDELPLAGRAHVEREPRRSERRRSLDEVREPRELVVLRDDDAVELARARARADDDVA